MKLERILIAVILVLAISACEGARFGAREKGALGGGAIGAGLGAIVGNATGNTGAGVAIGSGIGAVTGALIGSSIDSQERALDESEARLDQQERELEENRRLISELRSRGADVRSTDRGVVVNLPDVLFEFDSARLTQGARDTVQEIADVVEKYPDRQIAVEGHTDSIGSDQYNMRLSRERAESVAGALTSDGVSRGSIKVRGLGERDPIASNKTDAGRRRNRRVEVIIENAPSAR